MVKSGTTKTIKAARECPVGQLRRITVIDSANKRTSLFVANASLRILKDVGKYAGVTFAVVGGTVVAGLVLAASAHDPLLAMYASGPVMGAAFAPAMYLAKVNTTTDELLAYGSTE